MTLLRASYLMFALAPSTFWQQPLPLPNKMGGASVIETAGPVGRIHSLPGIPAHHERR